MTACAAVPVSDLSDVEKQMRRFWDAVLLPAIDEASLRRPDGVLFRPHNPLTVWKRLRDRKAFMFLGDASIWITEFYESPTGLKSHHNWLGGGDRNEIARMMPGIEQFGREHGCHQQTGSGRRGWTRAFGPGWEEIGTRKRKSLLVPA